MGRLGIAAGGFVAALALAIPLVSGGGFGASSPAVAGSGPATPPSATPVAEAAPSGTTVTGSTTRTAHAPESTTESATDAAPATGEQVASVDFAAESAVGDAPSWATAPKESAPAILTPPYMSSDPDTIARVKDLSAKGQECPGLSTFTTSGAPGATSAQGVPGTTSEDLVVFATQYNQIRYENCLPGVKRFIYDSCMEQRLFWMAESPSPDPLDAWGHIGSTRIDGVPSVGCDGNLAGGSNNTGATVATKWWNSLSHRASLYRPPNAVAGVCIALAMTHGGIDEPWTFTRAAAKWVTC